MIACNEDIRFRPGWSCDGINGFFLLRFVRRKRSVVTSRVGKAFTATESATTRHTCVWRGSFSLRELKVMCTHRCISAWLIITHPKGYSERRHNSNRFAMASDFLFQLIVSLQLNVWDMRYQASSTVLSREPIIPLRVPPTANGPAKEPTTPY